MGTSGVPWNVNKTDIIRALKASEGQLYYACKILDCNYKTLKKRIDADPELIEMLADLRSHFDEKLLDLAEDNLVHALGLRATDVGHALSATYYVLNNKGKSRNYIPPSVAAASTSAEARVDLGAFVKGLADLRKSPPDLSSARSQEPLEIIQPQSDGADQTNAGPLPENPSDLCESRPWEAPRPEAPDKPQ
jgi:hypothetical protein